MYIYYLFIHEIFFPSYFETFEKCSILFKFKPPARGAYAPEGKAKSLTTPYDLPDLRGRHEYIEYFEDKAKASLRAKFEPDTPPMAGGKRGRFAKVSLYYHFIF